MPRDQQCELPGETKYTNKKKQKQKTKKTTINIKTKIELVKTKK